MNRKMVSLTETGNERSFRFYPSMPVSKHNVIDDCGNEVELVVKWLNRKESSKYIEAAVSVCGSVRNDIYVVWNLYSGWIMDGLYFLHKENIFCAMKKIIRSFRVAMALEYQQAETRTLKTSGKRSVKSAPAFDHAAEDKFFVEKRDNVSDVHDPAPYDPTKKRQNYRSSQKSEKRGPDDKPYVVQVPGYFRRDGRYVKGYLRRMPIRKKVG